MNYHEYLCELADRYYVVRSLLNASRDEADELKKTIAFLQQSLDEATARNSKTDTPNLLNYPVRKLGKTKPQTPLPFTVGQQVRSMYNYSKYQDVVTHVKPDGTMIRVSGWNQWIHARHFRAVD